MVVNTIEMVLNINTNEKLRQNARSIVIQGSPSGRRRIRQATSGRMNSRSQQEQVTKLCLKTEMRSSVLIGDRIRLVGMGQQ